MPIKFNLDLGEGRKARRAKELQDERLRQERQLRSLNLVRDLLAEGAPPEVATQVGRNFAETGELNIPSQITKPLPPIKGVPERSARVPFKLKSQRPKEFLGFSRETGESFPLDLPEGFEDPEILQFGAAQRQIGDEIFVHPLTGEVISRISRKPGEKVTKASRPPAKKKTSQDILDIDILKKFAKGRKEGQEFQDDFIESVKGAAQRQGVPFKEIEEPGLLNRITRGKIPTKKKSIQFNVSKPETAQDSPEMKQDILDAQAAISQSLVTEEEARKRLKKKYGDKFTKL